jgi:hypothetical protein
MSGTPDWRWDDIQRGRDPDSLYWEGVRDEEFQREQRKSEQEFDRRRLDIERDRIVQDTDAATQAPRPVSLREDILRCRRDILGRIGCCVWLAAPLKEDWASRLANLTDAAWHSELRNCAETWFVKRKTGGAPTRTICGGASSMATSCATSVPPSSVSSSNAEIF